jgi:shikimate kinase
MVTQWSKPVVLLGFMGSGKSTLGKQLAILLESVFIDLDNFIETRECRSIPDIFEKSGEETFRNLEAKALKEVLQYPRQVVAIGGGTPCHLGNLDIIRKNSVSVYLKVSEVELCRRLITSPSQRPLLKGKTADETLDFITRVLRERELFYGEADLVIESDSITAEMIFNRLESKKH